MQIFKKLLFLLTPQEQKQASLLLVLVFVMALLDMIGVASILPFMTVLTNPGLIETNHFLKIMFDTSIIFGIENDQQFLFSLGILVFILLVISLSFKALTQYILLRFVTMREYSIGKRLLEGYLHQPYSWFLSRHSADLGKTILSEVQQVIRSGISPCMELIGKGMVTIALITLLVLADPMLAFLVGLTLGGAYIIVYAVVRKLLKRIGDERLENNELRFKAISEAFGAAKEVKVGGLEQTYIRYFSNPALIFSRSLASVLIVSQMPRFILEAIAFGGGLLIILYKMVQTGSFNDAVPIVSLYVFAGYRLMPALQGLYNAFTQLAFISPALNKVYEDLKNLKTSNANQDENILSFNKTISVKNIHYKYPDSSKSILKDINMTIPANSSVGIIGKTGSGKTTAVDIILGLLEPQKGTIEVDGKIINKHNSRAWQRTIGYVPQHIYLADDTVAANIAFGVDVENINQTAVENASKIANLHEFVIDELPQQYQTKIGERGVRLSGGQRQRIGIARALYHNPKLLILDEATSALDNQTEKAVMHAVNNLENKVTIILIAHRLSTVKNCLKIFLIEKGRLKNEGTFDDLIKVNENFRINANN